MAKKYYMVSSNADSTCDTTAKPLDLASSYTPGPTSTISDATSSGTFVEVMTWDISVSSDGPSTDSFDVSVNVDLSDVNSEFRWRLQAVNGSCTVVYNSAYSATYTLGGSTYTETMDLQWDSTCVRLRLSLELRKESGGGSRNVWINCDDAGSYVMAPDWPTNDHQAICG